MLHPLRWERLREDPKYQGLTKCMWDDYRSGVWSDESLMGIIDSLSAVLAEPSVRDHARWPRLVNTFGPIGSLAKPMRKKSLGCGIGFWSVWRGLMTTSKGHAFQGAETTTRAITIPTRSSTMEAVKRVFVRDDLDGDEAIGVADVLAALSEFGCASSCSADLDGDDQVGVSDILLILSVFGQSSRRGCCKAICTSLIGSQAVTEGGWVD